MPKTTPPKSSTIDAVQRYNDAFNKADLEGVMAAMTDDCVVVTPMPPPGGTRYEGQEEVRALWREFFRSSSNIQFDIEDIFAIRNRCLVQWSFTWVDQGNKAASLRGADILTVRRGKVSEILSYVKG